MNVSSEISALPLSAVSQIIERASQKGWTDTLHLAGGEPRFAPPAATLGAIASHNADRWTKYSGFRGNSDLLDAISAKLMQVNNVRANAEQILVTPGGSSALFTALRAVVDPGAEVIVQDPCWEHYLSIIKLCGASHRRFSMKKVGRRFTPDLDDLERAINPRTRAILLNTPLNPSGSVLTREELQDLIALAERHSLWLVVDEEYEAFVYDSNQHVSAASLSERVITLQAFSKTFSLTGIRLGYVIAPVEVVEAMRRVALYTHMYPPSPSQLIAAQALTGDLPAYLEGVRHQYQKKMERLFNALKDLPGIECDRPEGGVYLFPALPSPAEGTAAEALIEQHHLLCVPGEVAGRRGSGRVRLFFGVEDSALDEAALRIRRYLADVGSEALASIEG